MHHVRLIPDVTCGSCSQNRESFCFREGNVSGQRFYPYQVNAEIRASPWGREGQWGSSQAQGGEDPPEELHPGSPWAEKLGKPLRSMPGIPNCFYFLFSLTDAHTHTCRKRLNLCHGWSALRLNDNHGCAGVQAKHSAALGAHTSPGSLCAAPALLGRCAVQ